MNQSLIRKGFTYCFKFSYVQTFGVITMRVDVTDSNGIRSGGMSASLGAHTTSSASNTSSLLKPPVQPPPEPGQEVETHNLLVISQNTFEGVLEEKLIFFYIYVYLYCY